LKRTHKRVLDALRDGFTIEHNQYSRKLDISRPKLSERMTDPDDGFSYVQYLGKDVLFTINQATFRELLALRFIELDPDTRKWAVAAPAEVQV
jgi:hypothetical protein